MPFPLRMSVEEILAKLDFNVKKNLAILEFIGAMDIYERFKALRMRLGWKQKKMASVLDMSVAMISAIETKRNLPSIEKLLLLVRKTGVEWKWLMTGEGRMMDIDPMFQTDSLPQPIVHFTKSLDVEPEKINESHYLAVPLMDDPIAAGQPFIPTDSVSEWAWIHRSQIGRRSNLVAIRVKGRSMEPLILDGAIVAVDRDDKTPPGIFAARNDEGVTLKRVKVIGRNLLLKPENKEYDEAIIELEDGAQMGDYLIGRCVWQWSDLSKIS